MSTFAILNKHNCQLCKVCKKLRDHPTDDLYASPLRVIATDGYACK